MGHLGFDFVREQHIHINKVGVPEGDQLLQSHIILGNDCLIETKYNTSSFELLIVGNYPVGIKIELEE